MKICLVRCPSPFLVDEYVFPPLGLMSVATGLKIRGHDVTIYDGHPDNLPMDFPYYGFGPTIAEYSSAVSMLNRIKDSSPFSKVIIGGAHATVNPEVCINDGFDSVVVGDGEIEAERAFSWNARLVYAEEMPLDCYPMIDRSVIDMSKYRYFLDGRKTTTMMTSQGCPYKCSFCCKNYTSVRFRSPEKVQPELECLWHDYGYEAVAFPEDLFILRKERTEAICRSLRQLGFLWRYLIRADTVVRHGQDFVKTMRKSGCVEVGMGVESGSDKILSIINKGETSDTIMRGIKMMKEEGIRVKGYFIVGLPGETEETLEETRRFLEEACLDDVDIKIYQPYPGTPIWRNPESFDISWMPNTDYSDMFYKGRHGEYRGSVRTSSLDTEAIYAKWVELERQFKKTLISA